MKRQNRQFTKFISLLKFPGLQYGSGSHSLGIFEPVVPARFLPTLVLSLCKHSFAMNLWVCHGFRYSKCHAGATIEGNDYTVSSRFEAHFGARLGDFLLIVQILVKSGCVHTFKRDRSKKSDVAMFFSPI